MMQTSAADPTPHTAPAWDAATLERDFEAAVDRACGGGPLDEPEPDEDDEP